MVWLMDRLLKLENLDLYLTPYKVLATGQDEGMLEFIPSRSLAQVPSISKTIDFYLQTFSLLKILSKKLENCFNLILRAFLVLNTAKGLTYTTSRNQDSFST